MKIEFTEGEIGIILMSLLHQYVVIKESEFEDRELGEKIEDLIEKINFKIDVYHACSQSNSADKASISECTRALAKEIYSESTALSNH